jgi:hypothetical protein
VSHALLPDYQHGVDEIIVKRGFWHSEVHIGDGHAEFYMIIGSSMGKDTGTPILGNRSKIRK